MKDKGLLKQTKTIPLTLDVNNDELNNDYINYVYNGTESTFDIEDIDDALLKNGIIGINETIKNSRKKAKDAFGDDNLRKLWDKDFRYQHNIQIYEAIPHTIILKPHSVTKENLLAWNSSKIIEDYLEKGHLSSSDIWPSLFVRYLKQNKCERRGLLLISKILSFGILIGWIFYEIFSIKAYIDYKSSNFGFDFCLIFSDLMVTGLALVIGWLLYDPCCYKFCKKKHQLKINRNEIMKVQVNSPNILKKIICCMKKRDSNLISYTMCLCCIYPLCILNSNIKYVKLIQDLFKNLVYKKNFSSAKEVIINSNNIYETTNNETIELHVGEKSEI